MRDPWILTKNGNTNFTGAGLFDRTCDSAWRARSETRIPARFGVLLTCVTHETPFSFAASDLHKYDW
ncbi:hypothetical protein OPQ81_008171 [Rhizoctonia solani]|nr:hypothetical protein OPQ81_008171 [Rhizoctonia solani]